MPEFAPGTVLLIQVGLWITAVGVTLWGWRTVQRNTVPRDEYVKLIAWAKAADNLLKHVQADFYAAPDEPPTDDFAKTLIAEVFDEEAPTRPTPHPRGSTAVSALAEDDWRRQFTFRE